MLRGAFVFGLLCLCAMGYTEKAILEIVLPRKVIENGPDNGEYTSEKEELTGHFTPAGSVDSAEGPILQVYII